MSHLELIELNTSFLKNRIAELDLRQWWIAEQLGVDRKTVSRWVSGRVNRLRRENAAPLARLLQCEIHQLEISDSPAWFASEKDQREAAEALISDDLVEQLGPLGQWSVIEKLLRASVISQLPRATLAHMYIRLCIVCWRQSRIAESEKFCLFAKQIALDLNDKELFFLAEMNRANLLNWKGRQLESLEVYESCILNAHYFRNRLDEARVKNNYAATLWEHGQFEKSRAIIDEAILLLEELGAPMNISIGHSQKALLLNETGDFLEARRAADESLKWAAKGRYARGLQFGKLLLAEATCAGGASESALELVSQAISGFAEVGIQEGLNCEVAARVFRLNGHFKKAQDTLEIGLTYAENFPVEKAALKREQARLLYQKGMRLEAREAFETALKLWEKIGALPRLKREQSSVLF